MAKQKVQRQATVTGEDNVFEFDVIGFKFLVKNFTDDDILVALDKDDKDSEKILIPSESAQIVVAHEMVSLKLGTKAITVTPSATSTKGVEVQCLVW